MSRQHLLEPLQRDVREALAVERAAVSGPDDAKARVFNRVASTVGQVSASTDSGSRGESGTGNQAPSARGRAPWWTSPRWHIATFALGSLAGGLGWRATHAPPPPRVVHVEPAPRRESAPPPTVHAEESPPLSAAPTSASGTAPAAATPRDSLAAERALLDIAQSAFGRGESDEALAALARHEARFPAGQLAEEREALAVRSLVLGGHTSEARARAARFRKRYPTSVMLPAVEASLGDSP